MAVPAEFEAGYSKARQQEPLVRIPTDPDQRGFGPRRSPVEKLSRLGRFGDRSEIRGAAPSEHRSCDATPSRSSTRLCALRSQDHDQPFVVTRWQSNAGTLTITESTPSTSSSSCHQPAPRPPDAMPCFGNLGPSLGARPSRPAVCKLGPFESGRDHCSPPLQANRRSLLTPSHSAGLGHRCTIVGTTIYYCLEARPI